MPADSKSPSVSNHKVYADLQKLAGLQLQAHGFSFLPRQAMRSVLSGQHASRLRGRGLNFEELRDYQVGDDIRTLDWKVTNRTRKPHVRVFTEERERNVLLLVDQRAHMFFGSQEYMKSVIAAEVAALTVWRVLSVKDRIGALVFNDHSIETVRPQRSRKTAMQILHHIVAMNHRLSAQSGSQNGGQLDQVLHAAARLCGHDCLVVLISDMDGWNAESLQRVKRIKAHNDLIVSLVFDPLEQMLPKQRQLVVSDGQLQIEVDTQAAELQNRFASEFVSRVDYLQAELKKYDIPVLLTDTVKPAHQQLRQALGQASRQRMSGEQPIDQPG